MCCCCCWCTRLSIREWQMGAQLNKHTRTPVSRTWRHTHNQRVNISLLLLFYSYLGVLLSFSHTKPPPSPFSMCLLHIICIVLDKAVLSVVLLLPSFFSVSRLILSQYICICSFFFGWVSVPFSMPSRTYSNCHILTMGHKLNGGKAVELKLHEEG